MLKIGIIGTDFNARSQASVLKNLDCFLISGCFDYDTYSLKEFSEEMEVPAFSDPFELVDESDALVLSDNTLSLFDITVNAIKKGKHVIIENLFSYSPFEVNNLLKLANEANVIVQLIQAGRFHPVFIAAKEILQNPMLIDLRHDWKYNNSNTDASVIEGNMIKDIDVLLSIISANVQKISANAVSVIDNQHDIANVRFEFDNGCIANITSNRISNEESFVCDFYQHGSHVSIDFINNKLLVSRLKNVDEKSNLFNFKYKNLSFETIEVKPGNPIKNNFMAFYEAINQNIRTHNSIEDGLKAMDITYLILDKLKFASG
jgi:predicted dehydrogenase